jgi:hypothetical protein
MLPGRCVSFMSRTAAFSLRNFTGETRITDHDMGAGVTSRAASAPALAARSHA